MRDDQSIDSESADDQTIKLLNDEVALLRRRAKHADKSVQRVEALADAAAAQFAEKTALMDKEVSLLRERVSHTQRRAREFKAVAKASSERAAERGAMLHEVNHRAKNSIQMAISLLNLQRQASDDTQVRLSLATAAERLGHIARIHSMLYGRSPDQQSINFAEYLKAFCAELQLTLGSDVQVTCVAVDELTLDALRATNLALIVSEGVTNALKHAFPRNRTGEILISCHCNDGSCTLTVQDDGIGMTEQTGKDTMGLRLIRTLVKGVGGKLRIDNAKGARLQVTYSL